MRMVVIFSDSDCYQKYRSGIKVKGMSVFEKEID